MFIETSEASGMPEHPAIAALSTPMQLLRPILTPSDIATPDSEPCHHYHELSNLLIPNLSSLWMYADVVLTNRHAVQVVPWWP
jgi:hypothetical protein